MVDALKSVESVTAMTCGVLTLGDPVTTTAMGAAALFGVFRAGCAKHGLDSEKLIAKTRKGVMAAFAEHRLGWAASADVKAADAYMATHLMAAMPSRTELGAAAVSVERYPETAAVMIVERLAAKNPIFGEQGSAPLAREFALVVLRSALSAALEDADYVHLLGAHIAIATAQGVAVLQDGQAEDRARDLAFQDKMLALMFAQNAGTSLSEQAMRGAIARFIELRPEAAPSEIVDAVTEFEIGYRALLAQLAQFSAHDNQIQSLKVAAEEALEAGDLETARARYGEARAAAKVKASESVRIEADLARADAAAALLALDWRAADKAWAEAHDMLKRYDVVAAEAVAWDAADKISNFGKLFATPSALWMVLSRLELILNKALANNEGVQAAKARNRRGNILRSLGEQEIGEKRTKIISDAIIEYKLAMEEYDIDVDIEYGHIKNNIGLALWRQSEGQRKQKSIKLMKEARECLNLSSVILRKHGKKFDWARSLNNLGCMLTATGELLPAMESMHFFEIAIQKFELSLTVRTKETYQFEWAATHNNIGYTILASVIKSDNDLMKKELLTAFVKSKKSLAVRTKLLRPVEWADTARNIGVILTYQGKLSYGKRRAFLLQSASNLLSEVLESLAVTRHHHFYRIVKKDLNRIKILIGNRRGPLVKLS